MKHLRNTNNTYDKTTRCDLIDFHFTGQKTADAHGIRLDLLD